MVKKILTDTQKLLLRLLFAERNIHKNFYLAGGTALAEYYLKHRLSEDLDFFTPQEFNPLSIQVTLKKLSPGLGVKKLDFQQSLNRNLFFLHLPKGVLKTEFTYFPFDQIQKPKEYDNVRVDSLIDIAVNKTFTIYQNPRSRDFIDLYCILKKESWQFEDLMRKARIKFDTVIDPIQMGQQLLQATELKDYPRMVIKVASKAWQNFWLSEATKLKKKVIK